MSYDVGAAIAAGVVGGAAMGVVLYMGIAMLPNQMKMNLFLLLGTMVFRNKRIAFIAGGMMHAVMSILFGLLHTGIYQGIGLESQLAGWGILFGFIHWLVVGMAMGMMGSIHPRIRAGEMQAPGVFVLNYPPMTALGFLMLHLLFGLLVGALYATWA